MTYNGCTGQDEIDDKIEMVAGYYKVPHQKVRVRFEDKDLEVNRIVSCELKDKAKKELKEAYFLN